MTVSPPSPRVMASVPAPRVTATARAPMRFLPVPRRPKISRLRAGHLVIVQVTGLGLAASLAGPVWMLGVTAAAALALLVVAFGRSGGRWWYENTALRQRFRRRRADTRRALSRPTRKDPRLLAMAPSLTIREVELRGSRFGVGLDNGGWYAAFVVAPPTGAEAERRLVEAADRLGQILIETDAPVSGLQVVHHTVPVTTMMSPAGQWVWVALRLDPETAVMAAASRGGGVEGVHRALAAAVGRVQKTLRAAGLAYYRVLNAQELAAAVAAVGGWGAGMQAVNGAPNERWTGWLGPDAVHVCFRLSGSPAYSLSHLLGGLSKTSAVSYTISVLLRTDGSDDLSVEALLRVAIGGRQITPTLREVTALAARLGLQLTRLDGEHLPAVYAAAPTGAAV